MPEQIPIHRPVGIWLLVFLEAFLSIGALFGGFTMIFAPDGSMLGMPRSMLATSPFNDFFIPGLILFSVLGLFPALIVYGLLKRPFGKLLNKANAFSDMRWAWSFSVYSAVALIVWIQVEMIMLDGVHWLHTVYIPLALAIILVALLPNVRRSFKISE